MRDECILIGLISTFGLVVGCLSKCDRVNSAQIISGQQFAGKHAKRNKAIAIMRLPIAITLIGVCLVFGNAQAEEIDPNRLAKETASLFRVVMSEEAPPQRCTYGVDWLTYPIPEDVAQKYFGLTLHAALVPEVEKFGLRFQDIIDPDSKHPDAFCTDAQSEESSKAQLAAFGKAKFALESVIGRASFTLPVFDADYRKAVVIVEHYETKAVRYDSPATLKTGQFTIFPPEGSDVAKIYTKTKDGWQLLDYELVGQT